MRERLKRFFKECKNTIIYWVLVIIQIYAGYQTGVMTTAITSKAEQQNDNTLSNNQFVLLFALLIVGWFLKRFIEDNEYNEKRFWNKVKIAWHGIDYYIISAVVSIMLCCKFGQTFNYYSNLVVYLFYLATYVYTVIVTGFITKLYYKKAGKSKSVDWKVLAKLMILVVIAAVIYRFLYIPYGAKIFIYIFA